LAGVPADAVVGPVAQRLHDRLTAGTDPARAELLAALDGPRYRALREAVDGLIADALPTRPTRRDVLRQVRRTLRRADRQLARAQRLRADERDVPLHESRKSYKRARYAVEAVARFGQSPAR